MPQSLYPPLVEEENNVESQVTLEQIREVGERIAHQLAIITGLDLEQGES